MADSRHHGSHDWFTTISISFTYTLCRFDCVEKIPSGREVILLTDKSLRKKIDPYYGNYEVYMVKIEPSVKSGLM